jgi:PAS domain S-box-containing protein
MLEFASGGPTTVGVVGSASVETTLREAVASVDTEVSVRGVDDPDDGVPGTVDCLVAATGSVDGERTDGGAPTPATDVTAWATEVASRAGTPPVVLLAPSGTPVTEALQAGVAEYLPRSSVERAPATVLRRTVGAVADAGEADYRAIYDNVSEPLTLHDPDTGELVHANRRLCELLGYDRAELVAMRVADYTADIEGYDQTAAMEITTSATEEGVVGPVEWPLETSDGEQVWVEATLTTVEVGGRELVLSTATDVTDRRRQRRQLREITEHVDEVVYLARADLSEVLFVNDAYADLFGQPVERVYEDPLAVLEAVHPEDREAYRADLVAMSDHVRGGASDPYEFSHRLRVDGETRWVEVTGYPSRGPGGEVDRIVGVIRDVTDARRREREYEQIFNGVNDAIAVHDPETGEIVDVNDSYLDLYGYDREAILQWDMDQLSVPEEGYTDERARELVREVAESGSDETVEWRIETAAGDRRTIESNLTVATVGGQRRVLSLIRDVTEQRRRQREYEQIFHGVPDPITIHDPETGELLQVNDALCEALGYDRDTILEHGNEVLATADGYSEARIREVVRRVMASGDPETFEWKLETATGETRTLEVTGTPAEIGGEPRYVSLTRDITERRRRQREFEQIFHGVTDVIGIYDPETAELLDVNDTMCDLLGYDRETILDMEPAAVTATDLGFDPETIGEVVRRVAETGEPAMDIEWALRTASGEPLWLEVNATLAEIGGKRRVVTIARDVTERRDREQRVQVLNRVLRHNVRNDMDAVLGYATAIRETVERERPREQAQRIRETADSLLRLSSKARSLEAVVRRDEPHPTQPVETVLETVVADVSDRFGDDEFETTVDGVAGTPVEAGVFRLVVRELVENAAEHGSGSVEVQARQPPDGDGLTVEVTDEGPGIPDRVLTPFRIGTETQFEHNLGVGLWLINWGVRRLGGSVEFDCPPDGGTVARVRIPAADG